MTTHSRRWRGTTTEGTEPPPAGEQEPMGSPPGLREFLAAVRERGLTREQFVLLYLAFIVLLIILLHCLPFARPDQNDGILPPAWYRKPVCAYYVLEAYGLLWGFIMLWAVWHRLRNARGSAWPIFLLFFPFANIEAVWSIWCDDEHDDTLEWITRRGLAQFFGVLILTCYAFFALTGAVPKDDSTEPDPASASGQLERVGKYRSQHLQEVLDAVEEDQYERRWELRVQELTRETRAEWEARRHVRRTLQMPYQTTPRELPRLAR